MSDFLQAPLADLSQRVPHWLEAIQARGRAGWEAASLPTRKTENWKYTSLAPLRDDYQFAEAGTAVAELPAALAGGFGGHRLVFVDGHYAENLSSPAAAIDGLTVCRFADASDEQAAEIAGLLGTAIGGDHVFATLNNAALGDGLFIDVKAGVIIDGPLEILWLSAATAQATAMNQRLLCRVGANASLTIVEHFAVLEGAAPSFCNGLTELHVQDNAFLGHYRLHEEAGEAVHIGGVHTRLARDARYSGFHLALGSVLKRLDLVVHHAGPGAHADLNGVYLPRGEEHIDYHTTIEHAVPHCTTDEIFRGIIGDSATAVFNGRIHIHPDAQKTRAELSNRNLLTSNEATVNTKPELEIYADDVQCAHGATVAQLDATALHYLRTRGVSREEAEVMLSFGFINELIDGLELESVRDYLRPILAARFARDEALARHLL